MTPTSRFAIAPIALLFVSSAWTQQPAGPVTAPVPPVSTQKAVRTRTRDVGDVRYRVMPPGDPGMRPELRIAPPGMWWKNPDLAQKISLSADQQKRMDDIFQQSRLQLIDLKANVEKQEVMLEPMLSANPPDTNKVLAQIDHVAGARAELEKANARMLLGIRGFSPPTSGPSSRLNRGTINASCSASKDLTAPATWRATALVPAPALKAPDRTPSNSLRGEPLSLFTPPPLPGPGAESGLCNRRSLSRRPRCRRPHRIAGRRFMIPAHPCFLRKILIPFGLVLDQTCKILEINYLESR